MNPCDVVLRPGHAGGRCARARRTDDRIDSIFAHLLEYQLITVTPPSMAASVIFATSNPLAA